MSKNVLMSLLLLMPLMGLATLNDQLLIAVKARNKIDIESALNSGADVNYKDDSGNTPLHISTISGGFDRDIDILLLEKGADIEAENNSHQTPLEYGIFYSKGYFSSAISLLLEEGAKIRLDKLSVLNHGIFSDILLFNQLHQSLSRDKTWKEIALEWCRGLNYKQIDFEEALKQLNTSGFGGSKKGEVALGRCARTLVLDPDMKNKAPEEAKKLISFYKDFLDDNNFIEPNKVIDIIKQYFLIKPILKRVCFRDYEKKVKDKLLFFYGLSEKHRLSIDVIKHITSFIES